MTSHFMVLLMIFFHISHSLKFYVFFLQPEHGLHTFSLLEAGVESGKEATVKTRAAFSHAAATCPADTTHPNSR